MLLLLAFKALLFNVFHEACIINKTVNSSKKSILVLFCIFICQNPTENEYLDSPSHHSFRMNRQLHLLDNPTFHFVGKFSF